MNPRAAINDLTAFQAIPFNHLGTSPYKCSQFKIFNWRREWDSNPRSLPESLVFKTSSLNHSDNSPCVSVACLSSDLDYYILPSTGCQEFFCSFLNLFSATASSCFRVARGDIDITGKVENCQPLFSYFFQFIFLTLYILKFK